MSLAAACVLLLAAPEVRTPVGSPPGAADDPVARRVATLLVGTPVETEYLAFVPLHARVPSEARWRADPGAWDDGAGGVATALRENGRVFLHLANDGTRPRLVVAGTVFAGTGGRFVVGRDVLVPVRGAKVVPARLLDGEATGRVRREVLLPGYETGVALGADDSPATAALLRAWRRPFGDEGARHPGVRPLRRALEAATAEWIRAPDPTRVGVVVLRGGRPVAARVFATADLLRAHWSALLDTVAIRTAYVARQLPPRHLRRAARYADPAGRARAFLLARLETRARRRENADGGWTLRFPPRRGDAQGTALVDPSGRVVHAGFFATAPLEAGAGAPEGVVADPGGSELPPRWRRGRGRDLLPPLTR